jgi:hypothetical protein
VPNYDLLSQDERTALAECGQPFVATAPAEYPLLGERPAYVCQDWNSDFPMKASLYGAELTAHEREAIDGLLGAEEAYTPAATLPEREIHPPIEEMPFTNLSQGFVRSLGVMLRAAMRVNFPVSADMPMLALGMADGTDRLYLYNPHDNGYVNACVTSEQEITSANVASAYPVLPVKFFHKEKLTGLFDFENTPTSGKEFKVKLAPTA